MKKSKRLKKLFLFFIIFISNDLYSSTIAIIDSGVDLKHTDLIDQAWFNPVEIPGNMRDEDGNGYQDDIHGWNFAEQNNQIIDYKYLGTLNEKIKKFFKYQSKMLLGTSIPEEVSWMKTQMKDKKFLKKLQIYGNFMHGTHVSGISGNQSLDAKILAIKLIPTEVKLPGQSFANKGLGVKLIKLALGKLAKQQMKMLQEISYYIHDHKVDIANGSFGTGYAQVEMIVEAIFKAILRRAPSPKESKEISLHFLNTLIKEGEKMIKAAPNTLFVFAAGNNGTNNDEFPTSPANVKGDNIISVAATLGLESLAIFSNFGEKTVEVAAPGVAILSTVPGDKYLEVSGTSQAAPYVVNVASKVKDTNPKLKAKEIKKILMGTVDIKEYLKGHVTTSGLINKERAIKAAELSKTQRLSQAISLSRLEIQDTPHDLSKTNLISHPQAKNFVLSMPSNFSLEK